MYDRTGNVKEKQYKKIQIQASTSHFATLGLLTWVPPPDLGVMINSLK